MNLDNSVCSSFKITKNLLEQQQQQQTGGFGRTNNNGGLRGLSSNGEKEQKQLSLST